jgi:serine/threonine protein kinase
MISPAGIGGGAELPDAQSAIMNNGGNNDPLVGDRLGEYVLLKRLGGELAAVYKAWHMLLKRPTVLKLFAKDRAHDAGGFKRFQRETTVAGLMHHPNVVQAYDAREIDGRPILGMEYIDGLSLAKLVDHGGPLGLADACEAAQQAALGLHHIDQLGLVHRDIKPSNLMLARDGRVKIIDLGLILIRRGRTAEDSEVTPLGEFVGSADYCAPEQIHDCHNVDVRADLYGLGCTIFKLLTGFPPASACEFPQLSDKIAARIPRPAPPIRQVREDVPRRLAAVIDRLLAQDPQDRFDTAAAAAAAFSRFTSGSDLAGRLSRVLERMEMHLNPDDLLSSSNRFEQESTPRG